jgi:hypothetical protein
LPDSFGGDEILYFLLLLCAQLAILEVVIDGDVAVASAVLFFAR